MLDAGIETAHGRGAFADSSNLSPKAYASTRQRRRMVYTRHWNPVTEVERWMKIGAPLFRNEPDFRVKARMTDSLFPMSSRPGGVILHTPRLKHLNLRFYSPQSRKVRRGIAKMSKKRVREPVKRAASHSFISKFFENFLRDLLRPPRLCGSSNVFFRCVGSAPYTPMATSGPGAAAQPYYFCCCCRGLAWLRFHAEPGFSAPGNFTPPPWRFAAASPRRGAGRGFAGRWGGFGRRRNR